MRNVAVWDNRVMNRGPWLGNPQEEQGTDGSII